MAQGQRGAKVDDTAVAIIGPSLKVGTACGVAGFLFGGTAGILKGNTPFLFATASGIQTFALGSTFWACRSTLIQTRQDPTALTPRQSAQASTASGAISGSLVAFLTRGRRNIIPAALMWGLTGCVGQVIYNRLYARPAAVVEGPQEGFWQRMANKSWTPLTYVSNEEYAEMLREKMMKIDVEVAILDEKMDALRKIQAGEQDEEQPAVAKGSSETTSNSRP